MNVQSLIDNLFADVILWMILLAVFNIIWAVIKYLFVLAVLEEDMDHPVISFLIIWLVPFGFVVELIRNSAVDNAKRQIAAQELSAQRVIEAIEYYTALNRR